MTTPMQEPDTHGAPLREYTDPAYRPLCANLADVRANICLLYTSPSPRD